MHHYVFNAYNKVLDSGVLYFSVSYYGLYEVCIFRSTLITYTSEFRKLNDRKIKLDVLLILPPMLAYNIEIIKLTLSTILNTNNSTIHSTYLLEKQNITSPSI